MRKYVPTNNKTTVKKKDWFNHKCRLALEKRNKTWNKARKRKDAHSREEYKKVRNQYVRIRREEERCYKKDIINKSKKEPKLFYRL